MFYLQKRSCEICSKGISKAAETNWGSWEKCSGARHHGITSKPQHSSPFIMMCVLGR